MTELGLVILSTARMPPRRISVLVFALRYANPFEVKSRVFTIVEAVCIAR
jgi:hypothetical protein